MTELLKKLEVVPAVSMTVSGCAMGLGEHEVQMCLICLCWNSVLQSLSNEGLLLRALVGSEGFGVYVRSVP